MIDKKIKCSMKKGIAAAAVAALLLTGCKNGLPIMSEIKEIKGYSLSETMIFVATERNRYEQIYTDQIWDVKLDEEGTTFKDYRLNQVREFLQDIKIMNMLAKQEKITITGTEKDQIQKLAQEYFDSLTEQDLTYIGADFDDVFTMYQEYFLANKVVNELTRDVDLEISDSEAKVITVMQITNTDKEKADQAREKLQNGADFAAVALEYSEDKEYERQIGRGENDRALEDALFGMAAGDISEVISHDGGYYIFKCLSDYDEEATLERKRQLSMERKRKAFDEIYSQFKAQNQVVFSNDIWSQITFSAKDNTTTQNFFTLYQKYFPE